MASMAFRVWCAVTAHGFGHFSQMVPILRELARRQPDLELRLAGSLPPEVIRRNLGLPFTQDPVARDVGLVQSSPLTADLPATAVALDRIYTTWSALLSAEKQAMSTFAPHLVLANVPYLPLAAAAELDIPSVAVASLSWDLVMAAYFSLEVPRHRLWWEQMRRAYGQTTLALLPTPALLDGPFPRHVVIPPLIEPGTAMTARLRQDLHLSPTDQRPLVLVSLGGIPGTDLPFAAMADNQDWLWLLDFDAPLPADNLVNWQHLSGKWLFRDLIASVDAVVGKPGYGMSIETVAHGLPFLYVCRRTFPDEAAICPWLNHHGRAREITMTAFRNGTWGESLRELMALPRPLPPPLDGASVAVGHILNLMR
ncbi:MAG: hypothetical protein HQL64_07960 [Magnetococcales bacterium]|nr:hypothetical protein [Magnetococcales bacterium]